MQAGTGDLTGLMMPFHHHSIRQHALRRTGESSRFPRIREISNKRITPDDGICHHLHCPGKARPDRATCRGAAACPTGQSRTKLGRRHFCDMCISRKTLTTNLSAKSKLKLLGVSPKQKHVLLSSQCQSLAYFSSRPSHHTAKSA